MVSNFMKDMIGSNIASSTVVRPGQIQEIISPMLTTKYPFVHHVGNMADRVGIPIRVLLGTGHLTNYQASVCKSVTCTCAGRKRHTTSI
jgi:hypothetical protein